MPDPDDKGTEQDITPPAPEPQPQPEPSPAPEPEPELDEDGNPLEPTQEDLDAEAGFALASQPPNAEPEPEDELDPEEVLLGQPQPGPKPGAPAKPAAKTAKDRLAELAAAKAGGTTPAANPLEATVKALATALKKAVPGIDLSGILPDAEPQPAPAAAQPESAPAAAKPATPATALTMDDVIAAIDDEARREELKSYAETYSEIGELVLAAAKAMSGKAQPVAAPSEDLAALRSEVADLRESSAIASFDNLLVAGFQKQDGTTVRAHPDGPSILTSQDMVDFVATQPEPIRNLYYDGEWTKDVPAAAEAASLLLDLFKEAKGHTAQDAAKAEMAKRYRIGNAIHTQTLRGRAAAQPQAEPTEDDAEAGFRIAQEQARKERKRMGRA